MIPTIDMHICKAFFNSPSINPLTGRKIQQGKVVYNKLMKACTEYKNKFNKALSSSNRASIPPLGPMMHWNYRTTNDLKHYNETREASALEFMKFIRDRLTVMRDANKLSKSELLDYLQMTNEFLAMHFDAKITQNIIVLQSWLTKFKKEKVLIDDQPKSEICENIEIHPSRTKNRAEVVFIHNFYVDLKGDILLELDRKSNLNISALHVKLLTSYKKYLDRLIELNLFTHDDIYKKTFNNESFPDEVAKLYKQYRDKYYGNKENKQVVATPGKNNTSQSKRKEYKPPQQIEKVRVVVKCKKPCSAGKVCNEKTGRCIKAVKN